VNQVLGGCLANSLFSGGLHRILLTPGSRESDGHDTLRRLSKTCCSRIAPERLRSSPPQCCPTRSSGADPTPVAPHSSPAFSKVEALSLQDGAIRDFTYNGLGRVRKRPMRNSRKSIFEKGPD
jgi:hypothetical protein